MSEQDPHNDFESLCAGYVLGALGPEDQLHFEKMLEKATPDQIRLYEELGRVSAELALMSDPESPPDDVEERIFQAIGKRGSSESAKKPAPSSGKYGTTNAGESSIPGTGSGKIDFTGSAGSSETRRSQPRSSLGLYKIAAVMLLAGLLGVFFYSLNLTSTIEEQKAIITELRTDLDRQDLLLSVLAAREVKLIVMGGLDPSPDGYGKVIWDPENRQALLQLANIPAPPQDKDYQLWLIKDDQAPISAGVFNFDEPSTDLFFKVEHLAETPSPVDNIFAVTLEPKGGVPQPTGDMFLFGQ